MTTTTGSLSTPYPTPATSVGALFMDRVAAGGDAEAFRAPAPGGGWKSMTWRQAGDDVTNLAAGLLSLGVEREDRVGIASSTRLTWILADMAIMCAGGATTSVYPSTQEDDVAYILGDADVVVLFAENDVQADKVRHQREKLPSLRQVVLFDGEGDGDFVITIDQLREKGRAHLETNPSAVTDAVAGSKPEHLATLIYTSGTTGKPKGVELTQQCWTYEGAAIEALGILNKDDVQFLWLPLAHSFGKVLLSAQLQIGFLTAVDGRVEKIVENLGEVRPTFMASAPRVYEKVYAKVAATAKADGGAKAKIFDWAFGVGKQYGAEVMAGKKPGAVLSAKHAVAQKLVFSKIQERLGGRIRYLVSGSAALNRDIAEWFNAAGLLILEGYGLTETSAATCMVRPNNPRFGAVGEPFPGTEIRIAEDGEILVKGPGVMRGYRNLPEQTAEVMLPDGWFATGDVGEIDEKGRVRITDRKKDLVKTSGGKYIAPSAIESQFKVLCPLASNMVVHAEGRNFATAIVTLDPEALSDFCKENNLDDDFGTASQSDLVRAEVAKAIEALNGGLNRWETIKKFIILDRDFTVESGELTPSLKVKRKFVEKEFATQLDALYTG